MDYERISNDQFEEVMDQLQGGVWLKVFCDTISIDVFYPNFEFLSFTNSKQYQFGHKEYNEENNYQSVLLDIDDVLDIHKDGDSLMFGSIQIILTMIDDIQIIVESNQGGLGE